VVAAQVEQRAPLGARDQVVEPSFLPEEHGFSG
jgi:hypothetical protein